MLPTGRALCVCNLKVGRPFFSVGWGRLKNVFKEESGFTFFKISTFHDLWNFVLHILQRKSFSRCNNFLLTAFLIVVVTCAIKSNELCTILQRNAFK